MATELLVSVKSVREAETALEGGADVIDVKDPTQGPLGRAHDETITAIVAAIGERRPISAALGELKDKPKPPRVRGLAWLKTGLSGWGRAGWAEAFVALAEKAAPTPVVACVYADADRAGSPSPLEAIPLLAHLGAKAVLIDTFRKDNRGLLEWLAQPTLREIARRCQDSGMKLALAGSLQFKDVPKLLPLRPSWLAVRGAACRQGHRDNEIDLYRVQQLKELLRAGAMA